MNGRRRAAHYGFDAPNIMLGLIASGIAGISLGILGLTLSEGWLSYSATALCVLATVPLLLGLSMLGYGLVGKKWMRDYMIGLVPWRGDEHVLDVGAGAGLLLIAAAKKLGNGGQATGIDIWRSEDLSRNSFETLRRNIEIEGVADRVVVRTEDARRLSAPDASTDVVLSLFCIHNIEGADEQRKALLEIIRVLKPGGRVLVGEWLPVDRYAQVFRENGLAIRSCQSYFGTAFSLMWMVDAEKPASAPLSRQTPQMSV